MFEIKEKKQGDSSGINIFNINIVITTGHRVAKSSIMNFSLTNENNFFFFNFGKTVAIKKTNSNFCGLFLLPFIEFSSTFSIIC